MASQYEDTRDLVAAVDTTSRLAPQPTIEEPQLTGIRVNPIFISERVYPWWSRQRDKFLWEALLRSDILLSTTNVTSSRLFSIPVGVMPRDKENKRNRDLAYWSSALLRLAFAREMLPFIIDWQTQDNGAFAEIIGGGDPSGPIEPTLVPGTKTYLYGLGLRHLDSQMCTRSGDPEYPVIFETRDKKGKYHRYKLHRTRVLYTSQMPSPRFNMFGVGVSAVSRCISNALHLTDISVLKEEWLGARPVSEIVFGRGFSVDDLADAFAKADLKADAEGLTRHSKLAYIGIRGAPELIRAASIERIPLKRLPEGYDEETSVDIGINIVAMGYGFDPRELWPATVRGATRADAEVSHLKTMRKTPGVWVESLTTELGEKWVPMSCLPSFDQQDDEQDRIKGELRKLRAEELQIRLESKQINAVVAFQTMLDAGDINEAQYAYLVKHHEEQEAKMEEQMAQTTPDIVGSTNQPDAAQTEEEKKILREAQDFLDDQYARKNIQPVTFSVNGAAHVESLE